MQVDIFIVAYRPDLERVRDQLESIIAASAGYGFHLYIWDNTEDSQTCERLKNICNEYSDKFLSHQVAYEGKNLGFGQGHNRLRKISTSPWILILNQEVLMDMAAMDILMSFAIADDAAGAWELRQIPYEHPKIYDPVTLETPWVSCAACLFRRRAFEAVDGFEPNIFMYGEDVDISWRLRISGWKIRYIPRAAVVHYAYQYAQEIKSTQVIGGVLTNLLLRARFGGYIDILKGLFMLLVETAMPDSFPGRRKLLLKNLTLFFHELDYFRHETGETGKNFHPTFYGWNYALHREGVFFHFFPARSFPEYPLVSILVRTSGRLNWLRETLISIKHQTYPNVETVVVEDGPPAAEKMIRLEFAPEMNLQYYATGRKVGRSAAGNIALSRAKGQWLNFLDDDDVLFADHVEVLVQSAIAQKVLGVYALAWETPTRVISENPLAYVEESYYFRHKRAFSRIALWYENFIPIQSLLFSRKLYEKCGGFLEDMEQLEDWNLWTRYTLENDFFLVEKCTSKYRVSSQFHAQRKRQKRLDIAYFKALEKQRELVFISTPRTICEMTNEYVRNQALLLFIRSHCRPFVEKNAIGRWLMSLRGYVYHIVALIKRRLKG